MDKCKYDHSHKQSMWPLRFPDRQGPLHVSLVGLVWLLILVALVRLGTLWDSWVRCWQSCCQCWAIVAHMPWSVTGITDRTSILSAPISLSVVIIVVTAIAAVPTISGLACIRRQVPNCVPQLGNDVIQRLRVSGCRDGGYCV